MHLQLSLCSRRAAWCSSGTALTFACYFSPCSQHILGDAEQQEGNGSRCSFTHSAQTAKAFGIAAATPAGRPCLAQIKSPEQGQCTGKNSGVGACLLYYIPIKMAGGKRGTHRPWPLPGEPPSVCPHLVMWCLPKSPAVEQHPLLSQLICCLHPSHLPACVTSISFYGFSLGKQRGGS